jgi:hypothetical protein
MIDPRAPMPDAMRAVLLPEPWDLDRLFSLYLPVQSVAVADLAWQLELPWWRDGERTFAVSPAEVLAVPDRHPAHWRRTIDADLHRPIFLVKRQGLVVVDGMHRLLKAHHHGWVRIMAHTVPAEMLERIVLPDDDEAPATAPRTPSG